MLKSTNKRLNSVFAGSGYLNIEATVPVGFEKVYESPVLDISRELRKTIIEGMRFIIPPEIIKKFTKEEKAAIKVMASPLECGRVLEADQTVDIDGMAKVITFKGMGATAYVKRIFEHKIRNSNDTQLQACWTYWLKTLDRRRFIREIRGLMSENEAMLESLFSESYKELGIKMQTVLGIYRILELPTSDGGVSSLETLKEVGAIHQTYNPVILVRAMRSNLRVLDLLNLKVMRKDKSLKLLLDQLEEEYGNLREYFLAVMSDITRNNPICMAAGKQIVSANAIVHARNISIHGEEIDFETIHELEKPPGQPFSVKQSWPGVVRIIHHVLVEFGRKFALPSSKLSELVESVVWQTLLDSGLPSKTITKFHDEIMTCWKIREYQDIEDIYNYLPFAGLDENPLDYSLKSARIRSSKTVGRHG